MDRWEVFRVSFPNGRRQWCAMTRTDYWSDRYFDTFTEAIAYADQRARTVEFVVSRSTDSLRYDEISYTSGIDQYDIVSGGGRAETTLRGADPTEIDRHIEVLLFIRGMTRSDSNAVVSR